MRLIDADALKEKINVTFWSEIGAIIDSAPTIEPSEQYKKGFEDAKRAFELEYARESENMRKRNAELEVLLNAQKAISAEPSDPVFRGGKIPPKEMLGGTVLIPQHQWLEMERELAELKEKLKSAEPSGDLISRAEVLGYIDRVNNSGLGKNKSLKYIRKYVERTENVSAEPTTSGYIADDKEVPPYTTTCACQEENDHSGEVTEMVDLISRAEVLALINKAMNNTDNKDIQDYIFNGLRRDVHNLPSAERPKGEWLNDGLEAFGIRTAYICSCCGYSTRYYKDFKNTTNYCPCCGARMKGDVE